MSLTINYQTNDISIAGGGSPTLGGVAAGGPMAHISTTTLGTAVADVEFSGLGTDYEYYKLYS